MQWVEMASPPTHLQSGLIPHRPVIEGPGRGVEEHDWDEGVENYRED